MARGIDMAEVRSLLEAPGAQVPESAQGLLSAVEALEKVWNILATQLGVVWGVCSLVVYEPGGGLITAMKLPVAVKIFKVWPIINLPNLPRALSLDPHNNLTCKLSIMTDC